MKSWATTNQTTTTPSPRLPRDCITVELRLEEPRCGLQRLRRRVVQSPRARSAQATHRSRSVSPAFSSQASACFVQRTSPATPPPAAPAPAAALDRPRPRPRRRRRRRRRRCPRALRPRDGGSRPRPRRRCAAAVRGAREGARSSATSTRRTPRDPASRAPRRPRPRTRVAGDRWRARPRPRPPPVAPRRRQNPRPPLQRRRRAPCSQSPAARSRSAGSRGPTCSDARPWAARSRLRRAPPRDPCPPPQAPASNPHHRPLSTRAHQEGRPRPIAVVADTGLGRRPLASAVTALVPPLSSRGSLGRPSGRGRITAAPLRRRSRCCRPRRRRGCIVSRRRLRRRRGTSHRGAAGQLVHVVGGRRGEAQLDARWLRGTTVASASTPSSGAARRPGRLSGASRGGPAAAGALEGRAGGGGSDGNSARRRELPSEPGVVGSSAVCQARAPLRPSARRLRRERRCRRPGVCAAAACGRFTGRAPSLAASTGARARRRP